MGLAPLGDGIYKQPATWRIGSARIYKRLVKQGRIYNRFVTRDRIYKQLLGPGIGFSSSPASS